MKVVNVVLSVLILLLAIASAVFSYFLFDKRGQLVGGWEKMAAAINKTAAELDKGTGTTLAGELSTSALGHDQFSSLDGKLGKISDLAKQVITERDALADALFRIGSTVEMANIAGKEAAFRNINTYSTNKDDVINAVSDAVNQRNALIRSLITAAAKLNVKLDAGELKRGDLKAFRQLDERLAEIGGRQNAFERNVREIGGQTGVSGLNFDTGKYEESLKRVVQSVIDLKNKLKEANDKIASLQREIASLQAAVKERDGKIAALQKTLETKQAQIDEFKVALGVDSTLELPAQWKEGSVEARRAVCARVVQVSEKFGYVTINMGSMSVVTQKIGNKEFDINPQLQDGMELVVARGDLNSPDLQYVGRIKLTQVDKSCSIAEPVSDAMPIAVGDIVFFDVATLK